MLFREAKDIIRIRNPDYFIISYHIHELRAPQRDSIVKNLDCLHTVVGIFSYFSSFDAEHIHVKISILLSENLTKNADSP